MEKFVNEMFKLSRKLFGNKICVQDNPDGYVEPLL